MGLRCRCVFLSFSKAWALGSVSSSSISGNNNNHKNTNNNKYMSYSLNS